jgi:hypothetical protein
MRKLSAQDIIKETINHFENKLNDLVENAFQGKGFDYDDYIEMTGQMRNNYSIRYFLGSDLCMEAYDYIEENQLEADEYDIIQALSTEFSMRLEEKIQDSLPYSNRHMVAKRLKKAYISLVDDILDKFEIPFEEIAKHKNFIEQYTKSDSYSRIGMVEDYLTKNGLLNKVKKEAEKLAKESGANQSDIDDALSSYIAMTVMELNDYL